ncbi:MAG: putative rane protein [Chloroflexi bacterium]|nr:putative rane protein [Chloroflexota bacterium]
MADGLTVPFALAAGLSGAIDSTRLVVTAGLAEIVAGSIAMGLGGYLAAKSQSEHYATELEREREEVLQKPGQEMAEVASVFEEYGLSAQESAPVVRALSSRPEAWVNFMMRFELGLDAPDPRRALSSASTIGGAYAVGGLIPLTPYFFVSSTRTGLLVSAVVTAIALFSFGYVKAKFTGARPLRSALQTTFVGGVAATAAFLIAQAIS